MTDEDIEIIEEKEHDCNPKPMFYCQKCERVYIKDKRGYSEVILSNKKVLIE